MYRYRVGLLNSISLNNYQFHAKLHCEGSSNISVLYWNNRNVCVKRCSSSCVLPTNKYHLTRPHTWWKNLFWKKKHTKRLKFEYKKRQLYGLLNKIEGLFFSWRLYTFMGTARRLKSFISHEGPPKRPPKRARARGTNQTKWNISRDK